MAAIDCHRAAVSPQNKLTYLTEWESRLPNETGVDGNPVFERESERYKVSEERERGRGRGRGREREEEIECMMGSGY